MLHGVGVCCLPTSGLFRAPRSHPRHARLYRTLRVLPPTCQRGKPGRRRSNGAIRPALPERHEDAWGSRGGGCSVAAQRLVTVQCTGLREAVQLPPEQAPSNLRNGHTGSTKFRCTESCGILHVRPCVFGIQRGSGARGIRLERKMIMHA